MPRLRIWKASVLALLMLPTAASPAAVENAPTRAEFVGSAERVCRTMTESNRTVFAGVEGTIRSGQLKLAAPRFGRAARALEGAAARLALIPRPPADQGRLSRWLGFAKDGAARLRAVREALRQERRGRVEALAQQLLGEARRANGVVAGFDFSYCRMNPARFV
jgi:hypothetical protein